MHGIRRRIIMLTVLSGLMLGGWATAHAQFQGQNCTLTDQVSVLGLRIERCWRKFGTNPIWMVTAQAFLGDGSYLCQRWYNYVGSPGDAKDLSSVRYVFDSNGDNYPDCQQNVPPPDDGDGSCTLPPRMPHPPNVD